MVRLAADNERTNMDGSFSKAPNCQGTDKVPSGRIHWTLWKRLGPWPHLLCLLGLELCRSFVVANGVQHLKVDNLQHNQGFAQLLVPSCVRIPCMTCLQA